MKVIENPKTIARIQERGVRVGYYEGNDVFRYQGRLWAVQIQEGIAVRVLRDDVEFEELYDFNQTPQRYVMGHISYVY